MKKIIAPDRLTKEERECVLVYSEIDDKWYVDVSVGKLKTKFIKQGWTQTSETTLPDGTWVASTFEAPYHSVGIKGTTKRVRNMTDEQRKELSDRLKARFSK
jgi:hypothetical protein